MPGSDDRIPYAVACRHSPLWVTEDLEPHGKEPGKLVEKEVLKTDVPKTAASGEAAPSPLTLRRISPTPPPLSPS